MHLFCVVCLRTVTPERDVDGCRPQICCDSCCRSFVVETPRLYAGLHRLPRNECIKEYGTTAEEFFCLDPVYLRSPRTQKVTAYYLGSEVRVLAHQRTKHEFSRYLRKMQSSLPESTGCPNLFSLEPSLWRAILKGYLVRRGDPKVPLEVVKRRVFFVDRVWEVRQLCRRSDPEAAFDFFLANPEATAQDFVELRTKMQQAFELEGDRIMRHFNKAERKLLRETPLREAVLRYERRDKKGLILAWLKACVPEATAMQIVNHPACQLRIEREDDERQTASKLLNFWGQKDLPKLRERELAEYLKGNTDGHWRFPFSRICEMYITGKLDIDLEEILQILLMDGQKVFKNFPEHRRARHSIALSKFEEYAYERQWPYAYAAKRALAFAKAVALPVVQKVGTTFDYEALASGFWSKEFEWT